MIKHGLPVRLTGTLACSDLEGEQPVRHPKNDAVGLEGLIYGRDCQRRRPGHQFRS
jgi:hypothetical protein